MGQKAAEMLRLLPKPDGKVIEPCSGHGGAWGVLEEEFEVALKVGKPVATQTAKNAKAYVASECPLAAAHIVQGVERLTIAGGNAAGAAPAVPENLHPVEIFARAYGLAG